MMIICYTFIITRQPTNSILQYLFTHPGREGLTIPWYGKGFVAAWNFYYVWLNVVIVYHLRSHEQLGLEKFLSHNNQANEVQVYVLQQETRVAMAIEIVAYSAVSKLAGGKFSKPIMGEAWRRETRGSRKAPEAMLSFRFKSQFVIDFSLNIGTCGKWFSSSEEIKFEIMIHKLITERKLSSSSFLCVRLFHLRGAWCAVWRTLKPAYDKVSCNGKLSLFPIIELEKNFRSNLQFAFFLSTITSAKVYERLTISK